VELPERVIYRTVSLGIPPDVAEGVAALKVRSTHAKEAVREDTFMLADAKIVPSPGDQRTKFKVPLAEPLTSCPRKRMMYVIPGSRIGAPHMSWYAGWEIMLFPAPGLNSSKVPFWKVPVTAVQLNPLPAPATNVTPAGGVIRPELPLTMG
jgi:hypothetical protein